MIDALRKRLNKDEEGFTLIELMVVVLIIGILVAIAVPTFLNAQNNAKSKAAQSNARSALSAAKTVHTEKETYTVVLNDLKTAEPSLGWTATADAVSVNPDQVSWLSVSATEFKIAVRARNGDCFLIRDNVSPGGTGTQFAKLVGTDDTNCKASATGNYHSAQSAGWPAQGASAP